jgi:hypothetical protein
VPRDPAVYYTYKPTYINTYNLIKEELKDNIKSQGSFSITLDAWTAINQDAFLGITL